MKDCNAAILHQFNTMRCGLYTGASFEFKTLIKIYNGENIYPPLMEEKGCENKNGGL